MIEDILCSFEVAKLLDEKRFSERCDYFYQIATQKLYRPSMELKEYHIKGVLYRCPTYQHVMLWLIKTYNIFIHVDFYRSTYDRKVIWSYDIRFLDDRERIDMRNRFGSPEEAIAAGVKYALEYIVEVW